MSFEKVRIQTHSEFVYKTGSGLYTNFFGTPTVYGKKGVE